MEMRRTSAAATRCAVLAIAALVMMVALSIQACSTETVTEVVVTSVTVQPSTATLTVGETRQLDARVVDETGAVLDAAVVGWSVGEGSAGASVGDDGLVTGLAEGIATIRATFRGAEGTATLTILPAPRIGVLPSSMMLYGGVDGPDPDPTVLEVINGGAGPLGSLSATVSFPGGSEAWLTAELAGDAAPTGLQLVPESTGLSAGVHEAVVTLTSPDAPDQPTDVPVSFSLTGFTLTESEGGTVVTEDGGSGDIAVVLDVRPEFDVVLTVSSADTDEATVTPETLTFTAEDWDTPQTVTATGVDDSELDDSQQTVVTVAVDAERSDRAYEPAIDRTVLVTTADDEGVGLVLAGDTSPEIAEDGGTAGFTVALASEPAADVVISVLSQNTDEVTTSPTGLTFTPGNWDTPQEVTVTGEDDDVVDGNVETQVLVVVAPASDPAYQSVGARDVNVTTIDDEGAGFALADTSDLEVTEGGGTDTFAARLSVEPVSPVVLTVTSEDTEEVTASPATLEFTPDNWQTPQTVTLTGVDDGVTDGDQTTTITVAVDVAASDDAFDGVAAQTAAALTTDDDAVGFTVTEVGEGTAAVEGDGAQTIQVELTAAPVGTVTLEVSTNVPSDATVAPTSLTFDGANWDEPQVVTFTAVDDQVVDGTVDHVITVSVTAGSDPAFTSLSAETVSASTIDDDVAGFTVTEVDEGTDPVEGGVPHTILVELTAAPVGAVTFEVSTDVPSDATVAPTSLTFDGTNWDEPQVVTFTAIDDEVVDGTVDHVITVSVATDSDPAFTSLSPQTVSATTVDDDGADLTVSESERGDAAISRLSPYFLLDRGRG